MPDPAPAPSTGGFLFLYVLAAAGGAIAYVPFLTIILPMQVAGLAGEAAVRWLAFATLAGAGSASLAGIVFGWLSDRSGTRAVWIWGGLAGSCLLLLAFPRVTELNQLITQLVLWQITLNMMLAPLAAWAGDMIPDRQKGMLGGLLAFSPAAGAAVTVLVTLPGLATPTMRLWIVAGIVAACVLPLLLASAARLLPAPPNMGSARGEQTPADPPHVQKPRGPIVRMWSARLLVQISEAALFAFLYFWFLSVDDTMNDARVAQIFGAILVCAIPLALLAGRWSDRRQRPFRPLPICVAMSTAGLLVMAMSTSLPPALGGYVIFGLSTAIFLSLHTGQTLRVLPRAENRGRDLGIFNLANTVPSLIMPWLTLALLPAFAFQGLFLALALCTATAGLLLWTIQSHR